MLERLNISETHSCKGLTDVNALQNWNMNNAEYIHGMFCYCENLVNMDSLYKWKLKKGISKINIVWGCSKTILFSNRSVCMP